MHLPTRAGRAVVRALVALCLLALALPLLAHAQALDAAAGAATEGAPPVSGFAAYLAAALTDSRSVAVPVWNSRSLIAGDADPRARPAVAVVEERSGDGVLGVHPSPGPPVDRDP